MLGNYTIASIILSLLRPLYGKLTLNKKITMITLFYLSIMITRDIYFLQKGQLEFFPHTIYLSIITWVTLMMVLLIIEHMENHLKMKREYEYLEKINAISQLAASIAHEIRNPMTTVRGFLQLLSANSDLSSKDKSFIQLSIDELDRAQSIISEFLALSKPQKEILEVIDLTKIIHDSIDIITPYALLKNIRIDSDIDSNLASNGYKHEIHQVLINILKNGIEAMDGGTLVIHASRTNSSIAITIKDTGSGIPTDQLKRLGTPYYSTKEKGTGLGLTVSFEIVRRMNGSIHVESTVNQGTVFTILLPAAKA
jgi:two-component system sporulation sensor kinase B